MKDKDKDKDKVKVKEKELGKRDWPKGLMALSAFGQKQWNHMEEHLQVLSGREDVSKSQIMLHTSAFEAGSKVFCFDFCLL